MMGDYSRKRIIHPDVSIDRDFAATDGNLTLISGKANRTIYIQRIIVMIQTSAAQTITFEDSATPTPKYVSKIPASPGVDTRWDFDFGPEGKSIGQGKSLMMDMTAGNA